MQQWIAEYTIDSPSGARVITEAYYLPTVADVRNEISKRGGYVLTIRPHERSPVERWMARSSWWQVQLLRGIQFRSTVTSPGVALWRLIQSETNPKRQNILSPAREALSRGLGIIDALRALNIFDHGTLAILAASERSNRLAEGIPHAIQSITNKRKNRNAIMLTMSWVGFDIISIVQGMFWGKGKIIGWFKSHPPHGAAALAKFTIVVGRLQFLWNFLTWLAIAMAIAMVWIVFSFWNNRGKKDFPAARLVRRIPLIGAYLRDLGFSDSTAAAARMLRGRVPIGDTLLQASEATTFPEVGQYWLSARDDLSRGVSLGAALDKDPLTKGERMELAGVSDLDQVATVMDSISDMRQQASKIKHNLIVWAAMILSSLYLVIAFGSAIYALTVMNMSMDSMMNQFLPGAGG
ncbi:MAG: type II secretion system F family protein [Alphaproteobacteria bacterium]|nr:type II secretion system F family protein [Alphaproteobacteria bacterium]